MPVGQFHELAELRFDRVQGLSVQRLLVGGRSSWERSGRKGQGDGNGKKCLVHGQHSFVGWIASLWWGAILRLLLGGVCRSPERTRIDAVGMYRSSIAS